MPKPVKPVRYVGLGEAFAGGLISKADARALIGYSWSAFELMPPDPLRTPMQDPNGANLDLFLDENGNQVSPTVVTKWLPGQAQHLLDRAAAANQGGGQRTSSFQVGGQSLAITNIVGWGKETDVQARIIQTATGAWSVRVQTGTEGDGTVPQRSASWLSGPDVETFHVPVGMFPNGQVSGKHSQIWNAPPARALLARTLSDAPATPHLWASADPEDIMEKRPTVRIRVVGQDPHGAQLDDAEAFTAGFGRVSQGAKHALDRWGRATLRVRLTQSRENMNAYYAPVVIRWTRNGQEHRKRFDISWLK